MVTLTFWGNFLLNHFYILGGKFVSFVAFVLCSTLNSVSLREEYFLNYNQTHKQNSLYQTKRINQLFFQILWYLVNTNAVASTPTTNVSSLWLLESQIVTKSKLTPWVTILWKTATLQDKTPHKTNHLGRNSGLPWTWTKQSHQR